MRRGSAHNTLFRAAGVALLGHVAALALLAMGAARGQPFLLDAWTPLFAHDEPPASAATYVDLMAATPDLAPAPAPVASPPPAAAATGDETRTLTQPTSPQRGTPEIAARPAPDSGNGEGRAAAGFRRDQSTMRTRSNDGARTYQMPRERTSSAAASPQPIRQEPVVGVGDASRTRMPRPTDQIAARPSLPSDLEGIDRLEVADPDPAEALRESPGRDPSRSQGALDTEQGKRRFDVDQPGVARDTQWVRAASDENHPGRMELSAPASGARPGSLGQGAASAPGAVARPSAGTSPSVHGASTAQLGADLVASATERENIRLQAEIKRRVASAQKFPRRLALMLEQGETVVSFVVRPDGRLGSEVRVVKSAGFEEFDTEAVGAVTRAAPFPSMGRSLSVSIVIAFDNPLVR